MTLFGDDGDVPWVNALLEWRWTWLIARFGLTLLFLVSAIMEIADFPSAVRVQEQFGLHPGREWATVTIAIQVIGSLFVLTGRQVWIGAGILGIFTALSDLIAHRFWQLTGPAAVQEFNEFLEHIGLVSGFILSALYARQAARRHAQSPARAEPSDKREQCLDPSG